MSSSVLHWDTHIIFPNEPLFPIKPLHWDVRPHVFKLNPKSLKCIFLGYSRVRKGYSCYCPSLRKYLVYADVTFLENTHFSQDPIHTSQGEDDDLLVYALTSPALAPILAQVKPPITQVHTRRQQPPVSSPPLAASTSNPVLSDDLPIALRKGKHQCAHPISFLCFYDCLSTQSCSFIASLDSISLPNKVFEALAHPG